MADDKPVLDLLSVMQTKFCELGAGAVVTEINPKKLPEGITLEMIIAALVQNYGWARLGEKIKIKCFTNNPSMKSSLAFLRKTPWARTKVEQLFLWRECTKWDPRDNVK